MNYQIVKKSLEKQLETATNTIFTAQTSAENAEIKADNYMKCVYEDRITRFERENKLLAAAVQGKEQKLSEVNEDKDAIIEIWSSKLNNEKRQVELLSTQLISENKRVAQVTGDNTQLKLQLVALENSFAPPITVIQAQSNATKSNKVKPTTTTTSGTTAGE